MGTARRFAGNIARRNFWTLGRKWHGEINSSAFDYWSRKSKFRRSFFEESNLTSLSAKQRKFNFLPDESQTSWKRIFKSKKLDELSEGERQKLFFENELVSMQDVLLLDNPFCCLNENSRVELLENLRRTVKEKNLAVVFVTNNHEEAFAVCDRVGVLHKGEIIQTGTPRELYENPNCIAVAAALGRNNFIEAMRVSFNNRQVQEFQTHEGEHKLHTGITEKRLLGAINSPLTLAIRPEHISISFGASFPEDNLLKAEIVEVRYQGATTIVKLSANGLILEALVLRLVGLNIGDECLVGLPPDRILVLKD